tara:strand:+ start:1017 stop:1457 length:441 start_codon:yes stop_codon:yes gene_type:complete
MEKFLKSLMKDKHHLVLTVLLTVFILFDIKIPLVFAELVDNPLGKILVAALSLSLLSMNKVAGVVGLVAAFVLFQRAADSTGSYAVKRYLPTEHKKSRHFAAMNKFPITVEEEVISKMLPTTNFRDLTPPEFKPVLGNTHKAAAAN